MLVVFDQLRWCSALYILYCSSSVLPQADLEAQTREVAEREAATAERAAALQRRTDDVAQAERDAAEGHEALEAAIAARVSRHKCSGPAASQLVQSKARALKQTWCHC